MPQSIMLQCVTFALAILLQILCGLTEDADDSVPAFIVTNYGWGGIYAVRIEGGDIVYLHPPDTFDLPRGIAYDPRDNLVFFLDAGTNKLWQFPIENPSGLQVLHIFPKYVNLNDLTYDPVSEHLYATDTYYEFIYRLNKDGTNKVSWVAADDSDGVAVDTIGRYLYWTEYGSQKVMRAPLANPAAKQVIATEIYRPDGIYVDSGRGKVYWCSERTVEESYINGTGRKTVMYISGIHFQGVTGYDDHIYVDGGSDIVDITSGRFNVVPINGKTGGVYGIVAASIPRIVFTSKASTGSTAETTTSPQPIFNTTIQITRPTHVEKTSEPTSLLDKTTISYIQSTSDGTINYVLIGVVVVLAVLLVISFAVTISLIIRKNAKKDVEETADADQTNASGDISDEHDSKTLENKNIYNTLGSKDRLYDNLGLYDKLDLSQV